MNKVYSFIVIIPLIAMLFFKTIAVYDFDTKQRYIKNAVDNVAHKVMITGVMTDYDKEELMNKLHKLGNFEEENVILKYGYTEQEGTLSELATYTLGNILNRGQIFSIYIQSRNESKLSGMEINPTHENSRLFYKASAVCRVEKYQQQE